MTTAQGSQPVQITAKTTTATALTAGQTTAAATMFSTESPDTNQEDTRELEGQEDPIPSLASSSSSLDEAVAGTSASGPPQIDHHAHQDLLHRIARNIGLHVEEVIEPEDLIVNILMPEGPSKPCSLVVTVVNKKERLEQQGPALKSKESKRIDLFGRKVYSTGGLQLRIANQQAILSRYNFNSWGLHVEV
ncbi:hypothetical protein UY3_02740 [Chelonia mydas]|uniref:Uncharacterized protein n=1 Tax=Chelonia mydas TaxID=8469 RepID=M7BQ24_CHEMY|nr:hypothetical protein UY3_02740 [Chelonia mydas]